MAQAIEPDGFIEELLNSSSMPHFLTYKGYENIDQLFTGIGQSIDMPREVLWEIKGKKDIPQKFVLTISEIERDIHKFSRCCNPLPGLDSCLALLNRDGVSFHREHCEKYKKDREYALNRIQIMDVLWNMEYLWDIPLTFRLRLMTSEIKIIDIIQMVATMPVPATLHLIQESTSENVIDISVSFQKFNEARAFFSCFENRNYQVEIQDYGRHEFIMGVD
jgi:GTP pyrophosphokinase